jgi:ribosomal protein L18E
MLQHISQTLADRQSGKPKVDVRKIRRYIQDFGDVVFPVETMEEVLELVDWQEREIERLRASLDT